MSEPPTPDDEARALELLAAALANRPAPWPASAGPGLARGVVAVGQAHGVLPLLHEWLAAGTDWPRSLRDTVAQRAREEAASEALHAACVAEAVDALAAGGSPALVFKGTALACSLYHRPHLRPRDDTDLLVRPGDAGRATAILRDLGYASAPTVAGGRVLRQLCLSRTDARGVRVNLDLHWAISNRPRYAGAFDVDELLERAAALPALGPHARAPAATDALLVAAMHLHGHHRHEPRLIWLVDVVLLERALDAEGRAEVARRAEERDLVEALGDALARCASMLGHEAGAPLRGIARSAPGPAGRSRPIDDWLEDLRALPDWRARAALLADHALPPPAYMLARYRTRSRALLPLLYLRRAASGARRLLRSR